MRYNGIINRINAGDWYRLCNNIHKLTITGTKRLCSSASVSDKGTSTDAVIGLLEDPKDKENKKADLLKSRNKSGLIDKDYDIIHHKMPSYSEDELEVMRLSEYRRLFGVNGFASGIDMKALWPSEKEMEYMKACEELNYPHTVHEMLSMAKTAKLEEERSIMENQEKIRANLKKLDKWKKDLAARMEKKEREAKLAREIKQKQIDDVREVLGYQISPYDPDFEKILAEKIEEDKKKAKKEKKLFRQQKELDRLTELAKEDAMSPGQSNENQKPDPLYGKEIV